MIWTVFIFMPCVAVTASDEKRHTRVEWHIYAMICTTLYFLVAGGFQGELARKVILIIRALHVKVAISVPWIIRALHSDIISNF